MMWAVAEHILWKDIPGFEGLYMVSNMGDVYSVRRRKALTPDDVRGYKQVTLQSNGNRKRYKVHRLVALAFVPQTEGMTIVNHKDENKSNNRADNLEWCTVTYNNAYGSRTKRSAETQIRNIATGKKAKKIVCVDTGAIFDSTKEAERITGVYHSHISRCCNGKAKTAGGLSWRYA